ncbi:MAG: flagellar filament capping protein FliD [Actinobacteria bacterium]|nr:flagellar filament capping protein FliD [Actinomycetota bacterium]
MTISSAGSSSGPALIDSGLIPGLNTTAIINALLQPYEQPIQDLQAQQAQIGAQVTDYQQINSDLQALEQAAEALAGPAGSSSGLDAVSSAWAMAATSSASSVATASAEPGTPAGSISFTVSQLAQNDIMLSSGSVSSDSQVITSAPSFLLSQASPLGFSEMAAGSGLGIGSHQISVTQASQGAITTGSSPPASSTTISSSNDSVNATVNGTSVTYTLASGTYTPAQLAEALSSASGGALQASINSTGAMVVSTAAQGSAATLQITGGTALSALGLATMSAAVSGVDALVNVDGTVNDLGSTTTGAITAGGTFALASGEGGTIDATVGAGGHIAVASTTATNVSTGDGSLSQVAANIDAADAGITASAIDTGNGYVLQLSSNATGTAADLTANTAAFSSSTLGDLQVSQAGSNAEIEIGGSSADVVTSQSNQVTGLLPGLTANLLATSSNLVTLSISADSAKVTTAVQNLVNAANKVLGDINKYDSYNTQTNTAGPLLGSGILSTIRNGVLGTLATVTGTSSLGNAESVGITLNADGTIAFNSSAFASALQANPGGVEAMFTQGGTFSPASASYGGTVGFASATNGTQPGSYQVVVDQSASQAVDNGAVISSGTVSSSETLTIASGGSSAVYSTTAGESLGSIAAALNEQFGQAGMGLSAQVVDSGQQLQITSNGYGSAESFTVSTTSTASGTTGLAGSSGSATFTGVNVSGTIDGVIGTGNGQYLSVSTGSSPGSGLSLEVSTPGITSATTVGTFSYVPGLAQALSSLASQATTPTTGSVSSEIASLQSQSSALNPQIAFYTQFADQERQALQQQYSQLEVTITSLENQSQELSSALAGLSANGG